MTAFVLRVGAALAALALILIPAEVWSQPDNDLSHDGFDAGITYVDERGGLYVFTPFQILTNGDWEACPCLPASQLVLVGRHLSSTTTSNPEGTPVLADISVTVDGKPTRVYLVSPGQVNFFLRADVEPPTSTIVLLRDGREVGRQVIPITGSTENAELAAGDVSIGPERLQIVAGPTSQPSAHLLTTPLSFRTRFDVTVEAAGSGRPFQAMVWNPRNFGAVNIVFGPEPARRIEAFVRDQRDGVTSTRDLGRYELGQPYRLQVAFTRDERIELTVGAPNDLTSTRIATFNAAEAPDLFEAYRPSLTILSQAVDKANSVTLTNYRLELPHERFLTARADDAKIWPLALGLLLLSAVLHLPLLAAALRRIAARGARLPFARAMRTLAHGWWLLPVLLALGGAAGYLMTLGSHPFDMASEQVWTYLVVTDGFGDLYYRAQTVPIADIWEGMPFHEAVYPYGVGMSYFFYAIGSVYRLVGGDVAPGSTGLETAIKSANFAVALVDAALLFALARSLGARRFAALIPLAFLLNPAVLFDVAVWGETEAVVLFFLLASLLAARRSSARWAYTLLALAFLTKPTAALPAFLMGIYYLRLFSLRQTLEGISVAAPAVLAATLPYLAAGYPPSIAIDPIIGAFRVFGGSEMEEAFQVVSFDAHSVWPLVTLLRHGEHGLARLQVPDSVTAFGPLTYHQIGVLAFLAIVAAVAVWLLFSRRVRNEPGLILSVLAFVMVAELVLPTRSISRYLIFPLVFALAASSRPRASTVFVAAALTVTALVGMYGSVASGLQQAPVLAPRLAPDNNPVSAAALWLFRADLMITIGSVLNIAALLAAAAAVWAPQWLTVRVSSVQPRLRPRPLPEAQGGS